MECTAQWNLRFEKPSLAQLQFARGMGMMENLGRVDDLRWVFHRMKRFFTKISKRYFCIIHKSYF